MTEMTPDVMPPEERWLPGRLPRVPALYAGSDVHICLTGADVYDVGLIVGLEARFRQPMDFDAQREVARQAGAHRFDGWEHDGPHLIYEFGGPTSGCAGRADRELPDAAPWGHGNTGRLWRLGYWIPFLGRTGVDLRLVFSWPAQGIRVEHRYGREVIASALADACQVWPSD